MAWLEQDRPGGPYQLVFRFDDQRIKRSTRTKNRSEAEELALRVERRTRLVEQGELTIPEDADAVLFLMGQSEVLPKVKVSSSPRLSDASRKYLDSFPQGAIEDNTRLTMRIHLNHLCRTLGSHRRMSDLNSGLMQDYINARTAADSASPETVKKEVVTTAGLWRYAAGQTWVSGPPPTRGLKYPKTREKPPFRTFDEIQTMIDFAELTDDEQKELWDSLILTGDDVEAFLDHVAVSARHPFLYPMVVTAAHTGARRSELIRSELHDVDFTTGYLTIREKKRSRGRQTTRRVPMSERLRRVLSEWTAIHPGGRFTFCLDGRIARSRSQSEGPRPLSRDQAHDHFQRLLTGRWSHLRGWHILRHSFASNCAAAGIDQRVINDWMGHQTEEMVKRYRHLLPDQQRNALARVFSGGPT